MKLEPLKGKGLSYFYEKFLGKGNFKKTKIKNLLREVRDEIFPFNEDVALSDLYCKVCDPSSPPEFLQSKFKIRVPPNKKTTKSELKEVIIFGSRFQLKLLEEEAFFIDSTFQIVPQTFYQILTIIVISTTAKSYLPACHILMQGKHYNVYLAAFRNLND